MLAKKIIDQLEAGEQVTESMLVEMKSFTADDIEYILDSDKNIDYLLKCYITVMNMDVLNRVHMERPKELEKALSSMWVNEVFGEPVVNIIGAYMPITLFNTNLIRIIRNGFEDNYDEKLLYKFDQQVITILFHFEDEGKDYIVSELFSWGKKLTNIEALTRIRSQDPELYKKVERVKNNIMLLIRFARTYYDNVEKTRNLSLNALKRDFKNFENIVLVKNVFRDEMINEIFSEINIDIDDSVNSNIDFDVSTQIKKESATNERHTISEYPDIDEEYNVRDIVNKYKVKKVKRVTHIKIIALSVFLIVISMLAFFIIVSNEMKEDEMERKKVIDKQSESSIPNEVKYIDEKTLNNE